MKPLDTCIDSYAIATATGNCTYGHIRIHIHNTICRDYVIEKIAEEETK